METKLCLPHPYLTAYHVVVSDTVYKGLELFQIRPQDNDEQNLSHKGLYFTKPAAPIGRSDSNTAWARARNSPACIFTWEGNDTPSLGQIWLILYGIFTLHQEVESFRLVLEGRGRDAVAESLIRSMVAIAHPEPEEPSESLIDQVVVSRSAFWQGCASPFGSRPPWTPSASTAVPTLDYTMTSTSSVHRRHPRRPTKPTPGSTVYSRYIPFLDEHFSLVALDYKNPSHLNLFHTWQNDPRVASGWKETGTLSQHREYLRRLDSDPHILTVLGHFNSTPFSYFEIFWAKEDPIGAHYESGDFDRGRHTLVGDAGFRGPHRVMAWWPSIIHYVFLDDHRTEQVIGEPVATNDKVLTYDYTFGLHVDRVIDLPHKRASLVKCSRERFFQLCPFDQGSPKLAGSGLSLAKL